MDTAARKTRFAVYILCWSSTPTFGWFIPQKLYGSILLRFSACLSD